MHLLRGAVRTYAWGSRTAIADFTGRPSPTAHPEAELWLGAHPGDPTRLVTDEGEQPLLDTHGGLTPKHVDAPECGCWTSRRRPRLRCTPESPGTEWNSSITRRRRSSQCRCSISTAARPRDRRARPPSRTADPVVHGTLDGGARQVQRADAGVRSGHLGVGPTDRSGWWPRARRSWSAPRWASRDPRQLKVKRCPQRVVPGRSWRGRPG